jgi:hypothetical protein
MEIVIECLAADPFELACDRSDRVQLSPSTGAAARRACSATSDDETITDTPHTGKREIALLAIRVHGAPRLQRLQRRVRFL